jgi:hypothetical protein
MIPMQQPLQPHQMQQQQQQQQMMMPQQAMQPQMMMPQQQQQQIQPMHPQQQQQPVSAIPQNPQQQPLTAQQSSEEVSNHIFNPHQFNMLRTQIHSYKLIIRNEQVPQKILDVLKSKPPVAPGTTITAAMNGQPQQQPMQMNAQQIRMRNELNTNFFV